MSRVRRPLTGLMAVACALAPLSVSADQPSTTRIEPRVFYGATVTLEEGVRVFRPLPPHKHVIINPDSKAPVSLSFSESVEKSYNYVYGQDGALQGVPVQGGGGGIPYGVVHGPGKTHAYAPRSGHFPAGRH